MVIDRLMNRGGKGGSVPAACPSVRSPSRNTGNQRHRCCATRGICGIRHLQVDFERVADRIVAEARAARAAATVSDVEAGIAFLKLTIENPRTVSASRT